MSGGLELCPRCAALEAEADRLRAQLASARAELLGSQKWRCPPAWGLTASEARLFERLLRGPGWVSKTDLLAAATRPGKMFDLPDVKIVDVFVCKIRNKLSAFGVPVETVWGRGYAVPAFARARLLAGAVRLTPADRPAPGGDSDGDSGRGGAA